jgi:hypothetical protein
MRCPAVSMGTSHHCLLDRPNSNLWWSQSWKQILSWDQYLKKSNRIQLLKTRLPLSVLHLHPPLLSVISDVEQAAVSQSRNMSVQDTVREARYRRKKDVRKVNVYAVVGIPRSEYGPGAAKREVAVKGRKKMIADSKASLEV